MTYVKVTDKDGNPIEDLMPFPVKIMDAASSGMATEEKQDEMIEAIHDLAGGDSSSEIFADDVTVTDSAAALPDVACAEVWLQSDSANTEDIFIGNDTAQNYKLKPGESISLRITNANIVYAKTAQNTATLHYIARGPGGIPGGGSQPVPVEVTGSNVIFAFSGSSNTTESSFGTGKGFSIVNDGNADLTFTIGGITIKVKPGEAFDGNFADFTSVTVTTTVAYRAVIRG